LFGISCLQLQVFLWIFLFSVFFFSLLFDTTVDSSWGEADSGEVAQNRALKRFVNGIGVQFFPIRYWFSFQAVLATFANETSKIGVGASGC